MNSVHRVLAQTAAKSLRTIADELDAAKEPMALSEVLAQLWRLEGRLFQIGSEWMSAEKKAA